MILSDEEIKNDWTLRHDDRLWDSHLEANTRIRELESKSQDWHERYVICCEDSKLEIEALLNRVDRAEAKLLELAEAAEWRDEVTKFYVTPQIAFTKSGWWDRLDYENCRKADAEVAYQVALKAAKEG